MIEKYVYKKYVGNTMKYIESLLLNLRYHKRCKGKQVPLL